MNTKKTIRKLMKHSFHLHRFIQPYMMISADQTSRQQLVAMMILQQSRTLQMKDLAEIMEVSRQQLSGISEVLIAKGFIEKKINPDNRKSLHISLTHDGLKYLKRVEEDTLHHLENYFSDYSTEQITELDRVLDDMHHLLCPITDKKLQVKRND